MTLSEGLLFAAGIILVSYLIAHFNKGRGYPFLRSLLMALIGITGIAFIALKVFSGLFS
ncbi:MAG: hypothetical protein AAGB22_13115 [Bacteroidota bacterium]